MGGNLKSGMLFVLGVLLTIGLATRSFGGDQASKVQHVVKPTGYTPAAVSEASKAGQQIFQKNSCVQCHSNGSKGGCLGPLLAGVGGRRGQKFITDRITAGEAEAREFEKLYGPYELMPHPRLPRQQAKLVVSYLMTLPEPSGGFVMKGHAPAPAKNKVTSSVSTDKLSTASIQAGKKLFYSKGCMSCHSIGKVGGQFAVALDNVGATKGRNYISERMTGAELLSLGTNDEYGERGTSMPPSNVTPAQIKSITDYLMSLSSSKSP